MSNYNYKEFKNSKEKYSNYDDTLHPRVYNLALGCCVLYGLMMNVSLVKYTADFMKTINPIIVLVGYIVCCLIGVFLSSNTSPLVSFIGYNFIAVPVGLLLATVIPSFPKEDIYLSIILTGIIVAIMTLLSTIFPYIFEGLGNTLLISLVAIIVVELISLWLGFHGVWIDYIVVGIFSLYVGYDWHMAQKAPKNYDNAVDYAIAIYLDIINLFIRILSILSKSDD